jgi:hypothetical protein
MESDVEHLEVSTEEAAVKSSGIMKKRQMGRHLAAGRRGEPKELTRGDCGSRRKLAADCRKVSRRATVARHKGNVFRKIRTQGNCGLRKEFAAAGRKMTRCAEMARRREHRLQSQGKDDMAPRIPWERTFRMNSWKSPECKIGIMDPGTRRQLRFKIEKTSDEIDRTAFGPQFVKTARGMFSGLRKVTDWTVWRDLRPPKRKTTLLALLAMLA